MLCPIPPVAARCSPSHTFDSRRCAAQICTTPYNPVPNCSTRSSPSHPVGFVWFWCYSIAFCKNL
ncbi:hypothetical protein BDN72DRAFT_844476 [Pluteus cervinus]|uniref:Uncharacterized protein n=1 Tax=Pluteus cervinus TaxID=181527 RepID=A0ACD3ALV8_9AGAR|nr:hypothetical protein BDN72DRAFT_844476 [Pluteus cervinus]